MSRLAGALIWLAVLATGAIAQVCAPDQVSLRGPFGEARFSVEIADDDAERAQGLMHRDALPKSAGMLFVYDRPQRLSFWMRNTLIPLDLIFLDTRGIVQHVHHQARPLDETVIDGGTGRVVLEINGGLARAIGIAPGAEMRHPAFDDALAAWPCEP